MKIFILIVIGIAVILFCRAATIAIYSSLKQKQLNMKEKIKLLRMALGPHQILITDKEAETIIMSYEIVVLKGDQVQLSDIANISDICEKNEKERDASLPDQGLTNRKK